MAISVFILNKMCSAHAEKRGGLILIAGVVRMLRRENYDRLKTLLHFFNLNLCCILSRRMRSGLAATLLSGDHCMDTYVLYVTADEIKHYPRTIPASVHRALRTNSCPHLKHHH